MQTDLIKIEDLIRFVPESKILLPLMLERGSAGFPSPAENFVEKRIDLNVELIKHPNATYLVRNGAVSDSMIGCGILPNSLLIIDKDLETRNNHIVVARIENKFTIKRLRLVGGKIFLEPENSNYNSIEIKTADFEIFGRVTHVITEL